MIDFTKTVETRARQNSVWVDGREYRIRTGFSWWVNFDRMIRKQITVEDLGRFDQFYEGEIVTESVYEEKPSKERRLLRLIKSLLRIKKAEPKKHFVGTVEKLVKGVPDDKMAGFKELEKFWHNQQPLPHQIDDAENKKLVGIIPLDWKLDSEYIRADFLREYRIDLLTADIHWHDFRGLFNGLSWTVKDIMGARIDTDTKNKVSKKFRAMWQIAKPGKK